MSKTNWFIAGTLFRSSLSAVRGELQDSGLWCSSLSLVPVRQVPMGLAYGWQYYQGRGDIVIPHVSFVRWFDLARGVAVSLQDTLRHEYAHAFAQIQVGFLGCDDFVSAFGRPHDADIRDTYDEEFHVSPYAAENPSEDFAETFMYYLKYRGKLPEQLDTVTIRKKWDFVSALGE